MEGQAQEQSGRKQQFDSKGSRPAKPYGRNQPSLHVEAEPQKRKETEASMMETQSESMSDMVQTRVAELAYGLYEQRGRTDGHDLEDWLDAEQHIMTQGRQNSGL